MVSIALRLCAYFIIFSIDLAREYVFLWGSGVEKNPGRPRVKDDTKLVSCSFYTNNIKCFCGYGRECYIVPTLYLLESGLFIVYP